MVRKRKKTGVLLAGLMSVWGMGFWAWAQAPFFQDSAEQLRREIRLLNLVNGLELTAAQRSLILSRAGELKESRENLEELFRARHKELEPILKEIKSYLEQNREVPQEIAKRFHALEAEQKKARLEFEEKTRAYAREIGESLESHQVYQLERFVPCIIPPKGEGRVGQAADYRGFVSKLERIREIPDRLYERRKEMICGRTMEEIRLRAGRAADFNEGEMIKRIDAYFDKVRSLSPTDFEIQKDKLAEEFVSIAKPAKRAPDLTQKIGAFLLAAEVIPALGSAASPATEKEEKRS
ncbi:MAG: hypothetical protein AB1715_02280 [Acidobacteriota bacterium]